MFNYAFHIYGMDLQVPTLAMQPPSAVPDTMGMGVGSSTFFSLSLAVAMASSECGCASVRIIGAVTSKSEVVCRGIAASDLSLGFVFHLHLSVFFFISDSPFFSCLSVLLWVAAASQKKDRLNK